MPGPANPIQKIQYVIDFWMDPCDAPFQVYAKLALPALIDAFLNYIYLDLGEIIVQRFRTGAAPSRPRSSRKGGKGWKPSRYPRLKRFGSALSMDPNEHVGHKLARSFRLPRVISGPHAFLWLAHGVLQRLMFQVFLAQLILDFFYEWMTLVARTEYCTAQADTVLLATEPEHSIIGIQPASVIPFFNIQKQRGKVQWYVAAGACQQAPFTVMVSFRMTLAGGVGIVDSEYGFWLEVSFGGKDYTYGGQSGTISSGLPEFVSFSIDIPANATFEVWGKVEQWFLFMTDLQITVIGRDPTNR